MKDSPSHPSLDLSAVSFVKDYFSYTSPVLPANSFRISPSFLSNFFDNTSLWYRTNLLGEDPDFTGNTGSVLGTCIHAAAAMHFDTGTIDYDAIHNHLSTVTDPLIDTALISAQLSPMITCLYDNYLTSHSDTESEFKLIYELTPGIYVGGTIDRYSSTLQRITDFKNVDKPSNAKSFSRKYWFQQMAYAFLCTKNNRPVSEIALAYTTRQEVNRVSETTGKPLKNYPSEFHLVTQEVTPDSLAMIESILKLVAESVAAFRAHPHLRHIIMQDYRYKQLPSPPKFRRQS